MGAWLAVLLSVLACGAARAATRPFAVRAVPALRAGTSPRAAVRARGLPPAARPGTGPARAGLPASLPGRRAAPAAPTQAPPRESPPRAPWDSARGAAERLADGRSIPAEGRALLRENLARYLFNAYEDGVLAELAGRDVLRLEDLPEAPRWLEKISRDLEEPYADSAVYAHIERLQAELAEAVKLLREWSPQGGFTLALMGGIVRGRLSARSDLDVILRAEDPALFERAMASPFGYLLKERPVILSPAAHNKRVGRALGPTVDIGDGSAAAEKPGFLRDLYEASRSRWAAEAPEREFPPRKLAVLFQLKKLSKKALGFAPGDERRAEIEERMRKLSKELWDGL